MDPARIKRIKISCMTVASILAIVAIVIFAGMYKLVKRAYVIPDTSRRISISATDALGPQTETVSFPNLEGELVPGWYHAGNNGAAILFLHGLSGNRAQLATMAKQFLEEGFSVLLIDQSGHGEHPCRYTTFGPKESIDALAAVEWLKSRDEIDPHRIGIFGSSMGGTTSIYAASQDPDLACAVADSSYADLWEQADHDLGMGFRGIKVPQSIRPAFMKIFFIVTPFFIGKWAGYPDPVDVLPDIKCPLFLSHGGNDRRISVDQFHELVDTAHLNGMDITTYLSQGSDHCAYINNPAYINQIMVFFRRNLLAQETN
jgi:dipeptidyl aminopeptidase/acylaminoacyl peptidase